MTEELKNVIEVVDDLKATNLVNVQVLKKALSDISLKLEEISDGDELIFIRNTMANFKDSLDDKFSNVMKSLKELKASAEGDSEAMAKADLMESKFKSLFSIFDSSMKLLITKVDEIEDNFSKTSAANLEAAKEEFAKLSGELKVNQQEIIETNKAYDENTIERFSFVAESIKLLSENINIQTGIYKDFVEKKTGEIREFVQEGETGVKEDNALLYEKIEGKFKELEGANVEFNSELEIIKSSIADVLDKTQEIPQVTSQSFNAGLKSVTDVAQDTIAEIKILQDYSTSLTKSVNKIIDYTDKNTNEDIFEAIKDLDITQNIVDLFNKIDIFNNNFNIKTEFLEDQILQMKTMFSDLAIDVQNKEAEVLQRESQRVQEYFGKIESVSDTILNLEESLKLSGIEYKENIVSLNKELTEFISEFNSIYNELAGSTQLEITNSLNELKQFISVNSTNYDEKLVLIQEQFTQAFKDLYEVLKNNNFELIESGLHAKDATDAHNKLLESISAKIDVIASNDITEEILSQSEETQELIQILNAKVDNLLNVDFNGVSDKQMLVNKKFMDYFQSLSDKAEQLTQLAERSGSSTESLELNQKILALINEIDTKLDILATINYEDDFETVLENVSANKNLLEELHSKLDVFVSTSDSDLLEDELQEIKDIILEQQELLGGDGNGQVSENLGKLLTKIDGISETITEHDENSAKIKEDLVNTIVSVFSNSNFAEETEDIKDFVEEKTGELSKQLIDVKSQLQTIKQSDVADYSYTLADVENDIAKLRQTMNNISASAQTPSAEFNQISRNIHNLTSSVDAISKNLTPAELYQLKHNILKLNEDILSISSRTNKLLLNSDEAQKTIADGLTAFTHIAFNLEERMNELSNKEFNAETSTKLEKILALLENSASSDATVQKVLMYLGEWVDAASETFENINDKTDEIPRISDALSELRKAVPEKMALIDLLEERFEEQQSRMDRLESKLDELTEMTKLNSNLSIVQKVDKMEQLLTALNANIEKLTSYVD